MAQDGRVALVSVANRGIGREVVVRELAEEGTAVNLGSRSEEKGLKKMAEGIDSGHARRLAVTYEKGTATLTREVEGGANVLVRPSTLPDNGPTGVFFRDRRELP